MKQKLLNILKSTGVLILMLLWPSVIFIIFNVDINNIIFNSSNRPRWGENEI